IWTCRVPDVRVALGPIYGGSAEEVATLAADAAAGARAGGLVGASQLPPALHRALAARLPGLPPADQGLSGAGVFKSEEEIVKRREAGRIADEASAALFGAIAPGPEEPTAAAAAVHRMHVLGGREGFRTSVVAGAQAGLKHGPPRRRRMQEG